MRPFTAVIVFLMLVTSSALTGFRSYDMMAQQIRCELNRAMTKTVAEKCDKWITPDTIHAYRQLQTTTGGSMAMVLSDEDFTRNISIPQLRDKSFIMFGIVGNGNNVPSISQTAHICSDTLLYKPESMRQQDVTVALRSYARCSFATIWWMSDQKVSFLLSALAMLWAAFSMAYYRRKSPAVSTTSLITVGDMSFDSEQKTFYNSRNEVLRLTPMQHQLMEMFFYDASHKLLKTEICEKLWPGKEDASETLYTLIRRLKTVVEKNSSLRIEVERGRAYKLSE